MRVRLQDSFIQKLNRQVAFIAKDKPQAARKFKNELLEAVKNLPTHPLKFKKSIYFEDDSIRDLVFKGYTIVYKIDLTQDLIIVFGLIKYEEKL